MKLIQTLRNVGFTQQEAIIYITLCKHGELTGYEIAKLSGISRSNAYSSLSTLVEKGGANIVELSSKKYIATPKKELLSNIKRKYEKILKFLDENLVFEEIPHKPYITILGQDNIINKIKNIILFSKKRIYISANNEDIGHFTNELNNAQQRKLKIVIIAPENPNIKNCIYYPSKMQESIKLIVDTKEVVSGNLFPVEQAQCLYSKNKTLVNLIRETFINEIELIKIQKNNLLF